MDADEKKSRALAQYAARCLKHFRLYLAILVVSLAAMLTLTAMTEPEYTAYALISAPGTDSLSFPQNLLNATSISRQLTGSSDSDQLFSYYVQLLQSNQLAQALSTKFGLLPILFDKRWDENTKTWREPSTIMVALANFASNFSHKQIKMHPDVEDVQKYITSHSSIQRVTPITSSGLLKSTNLLSVSFTFQDPVLAQKILSEMLDEADNIIRNERKRDVSARIAYLEKLLPTVTSTDERTSLISALTGQRQVMATIEADNRFASTMVLSPYTPEAPSSPSLTTALLESIVGTLLFGTLLVLLLSEESWLLRVSSNPLFRRGGPPEQFKPLATTQGKNFQSAE